MPPSQEVGPADLSNPPFEYVNQRDTEFQTSVTLMWPRTNCFLFEVLPARPRVQTEGVVPTEGTLVPHAGGKED